MSIYIVDTFVRLLYRHDIQWCSPKIRGGVTLRPQKCRGVPRQFGARGGLIPHPHPRTILGVHWIFILIQVGSRCTMPFVRWSNGKLDVLGGVPPRLHPCGYRPNVLCIMNVETDYTKSYTLIIGNIAKPGYQGVCSVLARIFSQSGAVMATFHL